MWPRNRRSAITFDVGCTGVRAIQLRRRGAKPALGDSLQVNRPPGQHADNDQVSAPTTDVEPLERLIGQGRFVGRDVALVVSTPEAQFFPLRLPEQALRQPPDRLEQALKWEVAQQSRHAVNELEVRHWMLPPAEGQQPNVMAAVLPTETALRWCSRFQQQGLRLRRIEAAPCALVRLARCLHEPEETELWGVLDLGLRHSTMCVVVGSTPAYIRALSVDAHYWTRRIAEAFQVPYALAEQLKRQNAVTPTNRGVQLSTEERSLSQAADMTSAISGVLREALLMLTQEVGRCFSYVMQMFPDHSVHGLYLAGGGAELAGLAGLMSHELGIPVDTLANRNGDSSWEHPLAQVRHGPESAAALGGAILDLEMS